MSALAALSKSCAMSLGTEGGSKVVEALLEACGAHPMQPADSCYKIQSHFPCILPFNLETPN